MNSSGLNLIQKDEYTLTILDYGITLLMLIVCIFIGIYYGFLSKWKQSNTVEYIFGSHRMDLIPSAASLLMSNMGGLTVLALPANIYEHGSQYVMSLFGILILGAVLICICLPVFYDLKLKSIFTYLERRYNRKVRLLTSGIFVLDRVVSTAVDSYLSALALNQMIGINVHYITTSMYVICLFYTSIGGLRAVVWTDTVQSIFTFTAVIATIAFGTYDHGLGNIFEAADRGERLNFFNMDPNPCVTSSFWTNLIGLAFLLASRHSITPSTIQRCLSLPSKTQAKRCVWLFCACLALFRLANSYIGILLYAEYENCDPYSSGVIKRIDQILPFYILKIGLSIPGIGGLFLAGLLSAVLSTLSSSLNSVSAIIYEDFVKPLTEDLNEKLASTIMKIVVICFGIIAMSMVFVVEKLGSMLIVAYSVFGLTAGIFFGAFTFGMISPTINTKGILAGSICSLLIVGSILVGAKLSPRPPTLPFNTDGCTFPLMKNSTEEWIMNKEAFEGVPFIFRISYMYYSVLGLVVLFAVAYPVSLLTGRQKHLKKNLFAPFVHKYLKDDCVQNEINLLEINNPLLRKHASEANK